MIKVVTIFRDSYRVVFFAGGGGRGFVESQKYFSHMKIVMS